MKRMAGAAFAAVVLVVSVVAATAGGQAPQGRTIQLRELEKGGTFGLVDNPPRGPRPNRPKVSPGDFFAFSSPVADPTGKRVGRLDVQCVITAGKVFRRARQTCHGAFSLPGGQITLQASVVGEAKTVVAAVTGGTGTYNGARGELTSVTRRHGSDDTIQLLP
jgi:hypothetical protein